MSNGSSGDAEIDALLTGDRRAVDRHLLVGIRDLKRGLCATTSEVKAMSEVCRTRGLSCPGIHPELADQVDAGTVATRAADAASAVAETARKTAEEAATAAKDAAADAARLVAEVADRTAATRVHAAEDAADILSSDSRKTWAMWGVGTTLVREIALPIGIVFVTLFITGKL